MRFNHDFVHPFLAKHLNPLFKLHQRQMLGDEHIERRSCGLQEIQGGLELDLRIRPHATNV